MIKILYVHGYNGKPDGGSFQKLAKYAEVADFGGEEVEMHSFDYDAEDPYDAIKRLNQYYHENNIDLIIGSSLGGFLAAGCDYTCRIVVNPCWVPSEELPKVGYAGYLEEYKELERYWEEETKSIDTELCIGCFAPGDELLGTKYLEDFRFHFRETHEIPGGHHLSEEAAKMIMTEIAPKAIERFRKAGSAADIARRGLDQYELLDYAIRFSIFNKSSIEKSDMCGCCYCCETFPAGEVEEYVDKFCGECNTALCPRCGIDSVIPDADWKDLSREFLEKMQQRFYYILPSYSGIVKTKKK